MIINLDYDKTYTADKFMWNKFIVLAKECGHTIICITMRYDDEEERLSNMPMQVYYTSRKAKKIWADTNGIAVDIWIDDTPAWLFGDAI